METQRPTCWVCGGDQELRVDRTRMGSVKTSPFDTMDCPYCKGTGVEPEQSDMSLEEKVRLRRLRLPSRR